jgi:hypothetical protein
MIIDLTLTQLIWLEFIRLYWEVEKRILACHTRACHCRHRRPGRGRGRGRGEAGGERADGWTGKVLPLHQLRELLPFLHWWGIILGVFFTPSNYGSYFHFYIDEA